MIGKSYADDRRRAGPRRARRSRAPSRDRDARRHASSRATSSPTSRRRRWSSGWRSAFSTPTAISRRWPRRWSTAPEAWEAPRTKLKRPSEWVIGMVRATGVTTRRRPAGACRRRTCSASRCGARRRPRVSRRRSAPGSTAWRQRLDVANNFAERVGAAEPIRRRSLETALGPLASPETRQAVAPRREPPAGARAAVHVARIPAEVIAMSLASAPTPPRGAARLRRAVRLGASAEARARRGPRSAPARHRAARRARRARRGRPGRRSRLDRPARRPGARARRQAAGAAARLASSRSIRRCRTCTGSTRPAQATIVHATATPYRERSHFDGQDVLESGLARAGRDRHRLAQPRAARAGSRTAASIRAARPSRVGPVTPLVVRGPAPVLSWTPQRLPPASDDTAGAAARSLSPHRSGARRRARGAHRPRGDRARRRHGRHGRRQPRRRPASRAVRAYFAEAAGTAAQVPGAAGRPARRRARLRRLGHPHQRRRRHRPARQPARRARRRARRDRDEHGRRLARDGGRRHHRVRPHRAHQRHRRHRPRHRRRWRCSPAARSRAAA